MERGAIWPAPPARTLLGGGFRVDLCRLADRYAHVILVVAGGEVGAAGGELGAAGGELGAAGGEYVPLLQSVEGTAKEEWPPSPPLQELLVQPHALGGETALLVGMAGGSHWSAGIELPNAGPLAVDVACRVSKKPGPMASGLLTADYLLAPDVRLELDGPPPCPTGSLVFPGGSVRVELESADAREVAITAASRDGGPALSFIVRASPGNCPGDWPRTIRWRYTFRPA
ncbi:MAG: hypothetical protein HYS13_03290 [Planctomycetia bacterium]|nr:hypothetical protein [Planctomycetia bacterium]